MRATTRTQVWGVAAAVGLGASFVVTSASAIAPGQAPDKAYTIVATPSVTAGVDTTVVVTLTNSGSGRQAFGSARIVVPSGVQLTGSPTINRPGDVATIDGGSIIELTNMNIARRASVSLSLPVRVPCDATPMPWASAVKQSNQFNGTGNDFVNVSSPLTPVTAVTGQCKLVFAGQPANASTGAVITTTSYNSPAGAPVRVEVRDGRTTGAAAVASFTGSVSLAFSGGDATATLSGGTATLSSGAATFAPSLNKAGSGYRLVASITGSSLAPVSSNAFVVGAGATITCVAGDGQVCTTGDFGTPGGNQANITLNDADGVNATIEALYDGSTFQCAEYTATSESLRFDVTSTQNLEGLTKTVVIRQTAVPGKAAWEYQACFAAPYDFPAVLPSQLAQDFAAFDFSGNTTTAVVDGQTVYRGLLLNCLALAGAPALPVQPCVEDRTVNTSSGIATMVLRVAAADPQVRF